MAFLHALTKTLESASLQRCSAGDTRHLVLVRLSDLDLIVAAGSHLVPQACQTLQAGLGAPLPSWSTGNPAQDRSLPVALTADTMQLKKCA